MGASNFRPSVASFFYPGIIVAAVGLFGYLKYKPTLSTVRPRDTAPMVDRQEEKTDSDYTAHTRLWEDPLEAIYSQMQHLEESQAGKDSGRTAAIPFMSNDGLVLPVMLTGGPNPVDRERRMRTRYAVISALTTANYRPDSSRCLRHVRVPTCSGAVVWVPYELYKADVCDPLYDQFDSIVFKQVLILWIDEDQLGGEPFHALRHVLAGCVPKASDAASPSLEVRVIGPSCTDSLLRLAQEWCEEMGDEPEEMFCGVRQDGPCPFVDEDGSASREGQRHSPTQSGDEEVAARWRLKFFSPRATIEPAALKYEKAKTGFNAELYVKRFTGRMTPASFAQREDWPPRGPDFTAVIGTDWHLVHAIQKELVARQCWPQHVCGQ